MAIHFQHLKGKKTKKTIVPALRIHSHVYITTVCLNAGEITLRIFSVLY